MVARYRFLGSFHINNGEFIDITDRTILLVYLRLPRQSMAKANHSRCF
jgi:hypothetical protein